MANRAKKKVIGLIEDDVVIANILEKKLTQTGYDVRMAADGVVGLKMIASAKPDLVLLDMALPQMSGSEVLDKLAKQKLIPKLPVIIISNSGQQAEIDKAVKLGVKDHLVKVNFDLDDLVMKIGSVLNTNSKKKDSKNVEIEGNMLIVEDDILLLNLLEKKLLTSTIKPFRATDVNEARSILESQKIDIILLDVVLPGGNGIDFLKEIKANKKWKSIPVIITSNLGQNEEVQRGFDAGAVAYVVKANVTPDDIVAKAKKYLKK